MQQAAGGIRSSFSTHTARQSNRAVGVDQDVIETRDRAGALAVLRERLVRGDVVLVKASRGLELDRLADDLLAGLT